MSFLTTNIAIMMCHIMEELNQAAQERRSLSLKAQRWITQVQLLDQGLNLSI